MNTLCGASFIFYGIFVGEKSEGKTHPDYVPTIFSFVKSPEKKQG